MKKLTILFISLIFIFSSTVFSKRGNKKGSSIQARLVAQIYNIYKTQSYRKALKITTGSMKKRFKKLYDYLRMHQYRIPTRLKKLSAMLHDYRFVGQYDQTLKGKKYSLIDCIWVLKYRDNSKYGSGMTKTKIVVRAYLVKKVKGRWKVSSEKFITEHILRDEEFKHNKMIERSIKKQRIKRMRRKRYGGARQYRRRRYYRRNG